VGPARLLDRNPRAGYKVIFVPFANASRQAKPKDVLHRILNADGEAQGRPVGVAIDKQGALLVADDVGQRDLARDAGGKVGGAIGATSSLRSSLCAAQWIASRSLSSGGALRRPVGSPMTESSTVSPDGANGSARSAAR